MGLPNRASSSATASINSASVRRLVVRDDRATLRSLNGYLRWVTLREDGHPRRGLVFYVMYYCNK
jgi:hypothetical protein